MALRRNLARGQYILSVLGFAAGALMYLSALLGQPADARRVFFGVHLGALVFLGLTAYWVFDLTDKTCRGPGTFSWEHVWRGSPAMRVRVFKIAFAASLGGALVARYVLAASDGVASGMMFATVWMGFYGVSALTVFSWLKVRGNWEHG
jgi:hypothetical protein